MGRKKKNLFPIGFCGSFFSTQFLEEVKNDVLEELNDKISTVEFFKSFIASYDFKDFPYMKDIGMLMINDEAVYGEHDDITGYYVGVNIYDLPEHLSLKRIKIDVRTMMEQIGIIHKDEDDDVIQIVPLIVEI